MPEVPLSENLEVQRIDPRERARFYAQKGIPFAAEKFAEYAGLTDEEKDEIEISAHEAAAATQKLIGDSSTKVRSHPNGEQTASLFTQAGDTQMRDVIVSLASGRLSEGGGDIFLHHTLSTLQRKIAAIDAYAKLQQQAHTDIAEYLKQESSDQATGAK